MVAISCSPFEQDYHWVIEANYMSPSRINVSASAINFVASYTKAAISSEGVTE